MKFNAINKDQFINKNSSINEIECFMQHGINLNSIKYFSNLKIITIIRQSQVNSMKMIENCII